MDYLWNIFICFNLSNQNSKIIANRNLLKLNREIISEEFLYYSFFKFKKVEMFFQENQSGQNVGGSNKSKEKGEINEQI